MPTSTEQYFRVLVPGTEPMGEEISVSHIHSLLLSKQIFMDTQVWDEDRKCWSSLMECTSTQKIIQNVLPYPVLQNQELEDMEFETEDRMMETNTIYGEENTYDENEIATIDILDVSSSQPSKNDEIPPIESNPSLSLWDAWDESSLREIAEPTTKNSNIRISEVLPSTLIELPVDTTNAKHVEQKDRDVVSESHSFQNESNIEGQLLHNSWTEISKEHQHPEPSTNHFESTEIEIDLEDSLLEETTSDIPILPLDDLIDRQAQLEAELSADMESITSQKSVATSSSESHGTSPISLPSQIQNPKSSNWQDFSKQSKKIHQEQQTVDFLTKQIFSAKKLDDLHDLHSKGFDVTRRPPRQQKSFSMLRIIMLLLPGLLIFWVFQLYIQAVSETKVERLSKPTISEETEELTYYDLMELDIRENIPKDVKPVRQTQAESLQSALFVQLSQQSLHISDIDAVVTKWGGRKLDEPQRAEISITLSSEQEIDRDIAKIAMTIGLYMEHYALQIDKLEVVYKDTLHLYSIPIEPSHRLFLKDVNLEQFFQDMLSQ